ncbi:unnamed protein product, partial [Pylaiella littoralis]
MCCDLSLLCGCAIFQIDFVWLFNFRSPSVTLGHIMRAWFFFFWIWLMLRLYSPVFGDMYPVALSICFFLFWPDCSHGLQRWNFGGSIYDVRLCTLIYLFRDLG